MVNELLLAVFIGGNFSVGFVFCYGYFVTSNMFNFEFVIETKWFV